MDGDAKHRLAREMSSESEKVKISNGEATRNIGRKVVVKFLLRDECVRRTTKTRGVDSIL